MPEKFISKTNGVYKISYSFRMNIMEEIFEIRSCLESLANNIKIDTAVLQGIHIGDLRLLTGSHKCRCCGALSATISDYVACSNTQDKT